MTSVNFRQVSHELVDFNSYGVSYPSRRLYGQVSHELVDFNTQDECGLIDTALSQVSHELVDFNIDYMRCQRGQ